MVQLPVWELGLIILFPMTGAYLLRPFAIARYVDTVPPIQQSFRQFQTELVLYFAAGIIMAFFLLLTHSFPLLESGFKLVLGIFTVGLFAALDIALARERQVIRMALSGNGPFEPPSRFSPLTRRFSLVATLILLLITGIMLLVLIRDVHWLAEQDLTIASVDELGRSVLLEIIFVMGFLLLMIVNLIFSYARNLRILFDNETSVLESVTEGDLSRQVPVTTSDEMGVIAGHTNTMIRSLRDSQRMREGLRIAHEVQQHFLPKQPLPLEGVDIAGTASFSDETGGDFYDYIECERPDCQLVTVAVGDVSGHGIGAALLMAEGRALIRQSTSSPGSPAQNVGTANMHLARDVEGTGRFMTLFYIVLDPVTKRMTWVNAGHQPPLFYDRSTDTFTELKGKDIPLGVIDDWLFHENYNLLPTSDQVILVGTDGIWEAISPDGEMFGPARIKEIIRKHADQPAEHIVQALEASVHEFAGRRSQRDDVTLVVIKGK